MSGDRFQTGIAVTALFGMGLVNEPLSGVQRKLASVNTSQHQTTLRGGADGGVRRWVGPGACGR